ncbi:hypothetical protein HZ326_9328 [Fusarium oxysporum f. sp. albedinis]|nr:hypothetical protein HZ326_9328 [Fusarium oxysporum f. sp. albedinis]
MEKRDSGILILSQLMGMGTRSNVEDLYRSSWFCLCQKMTKSRYWRKDDTLFFFLSFFICPFGLILVLIWIRRTSTFDRHGRPRHASCRMNGVGRRMICVKLSLFLINVSELGLVPSIVSCV